MSQAQQATNILALDVGEKRIGLARVNTIARLPETLTTVPNDDNFQPILSQIIKDYSIDILVVGLPRNLQGSETAQTEYVQVFCQEKLEFFGLPIVFQDETLTSVAAEAYLGQRAIRDKGLVDAEAARMILQDYLGDHDEI